MTRLLCLLMILAGAAYAEEIKWDDLCYRTGSREITIKTTAGNKVAGTCDINTDFSVSLHTKGGLRTVARDDVASIRIEKIRQGNCLKNGIIKAQSSFEFGILTLVSPLFIYAPYYFVSSPLILVGGPPVCGVRALVDRMNSSERVTII